MVMENSPHLFTIRANTPKEFDPLKHKVVKFKRDNWKNYHTLDLDGLYSYKGENAENIYSEGALLSLSYMTVVEYINR